MHYIADKRQNWDIFCFCSSMLTSHGCFKVLKLPHAVCNLAAYHWDKSYYEQIRQDFVSQNRKSPSRNCVQCFMLASSRFVKKLISICGKHKQDISTLTTTITHYNSLPHRRVCLFIQTTTIKRIGFA